MRIALLAVAVCFSSSLWAQSGDTPVQVAQKLFEAMKAHDASSASALFLPGAILASSDVSGKASVTPIEKFVEHIGTNKSDWLERISTPKVLERSSISVVWAEYEFYLNGKFHHCGIDSFSLLKTDGKWEIAAITDTRDNSGCKQNPTH